MSHVAGVMAQEMSDAITALTNIKSYTKTAYSHASHYALKAISTKILLMNAYVNY
jgi:hypothetical protein